MLNNINRMSNEELVGLAKNRFLPANMQMAIAKVPYKRVNAYLAANPGLDESVRDYLWSDQCNSGYVLKAGLLSAGHYMDSPEKYWHLYRGYPSMWKRSHWRTVRCFIGLYSWNAPGGQYTPSDLLDEIYKSKLDPRIVGADMMHRYVRRTALQALAQHPNCSLELAIRLSTCGDERVQKFAFEKIVELS